MKYLVGALILLSFDFTITTTVMAQSETINDKELSITCDYSPTDGGCKVDAICSFYCTKKVISFQEFLNLKVGKGMAYFVDVDRDAYRGKAKIKYRLIEKVKTFKTEDGGPNVSGK